MIAETTKSDLGLDFGLNVESGFRFADIGAKRQNMKYPCRKRLKKLNIFFS